MNGVLNVDKPGGLTSHDVVARIRRACGQRRVGHAGTLDPLATGVLLVCLGQATRIAEYLTAGRKEYRATVRLGASTDTYDAEGQVVEERAVDPDDSQLRERLRHELERFRGEIEQVPPVYSAIKQGGEPLYRRARRGEVVQPRARTVTIDEIELESWSGPDAIIRLTCSPGTYVRSFAHDLGQVLGCGAHLAALVRTGSGSFRVESATSLDEIERSAEDGTLPSRVVPMDSALSQLPALDLSPAELDAVRVGQFLSRPPPVGSPDIPCRGRDPDGELVAILQFDTGRQRWRPRKVFLAGS